MSNLISRLISSLRAVESVSEGSATSKLPSGLRLPHQIRVAHLATRLIIAGLGNVVASLVRGMPKPQYRSTVVCLEEADVLGRLLKDEGHEVIELGRYRRRDFGLFVRIAIFLRRNHIDILHCHDELSWFYGTLGARLGGVNRVVVTMHGRRADFSMRHRWEQRILAKLSRSIICVSSYLQRQIQTELRVLPDKVPVIRNGIPINPIDDDAEIRHRVRQALNLSEDEIVVGCVGRLDTVKNLDLLIDAVHKARAVIPSLRLAIVGEGPCRDHLFQKISQLGLVEAVIFTGLRRDVHELLCSFDLYVCSSDYEGVSLSILEAMAARRAIIATAVGGNVEIVSQNETGILVQPRDIQEMVEAIVALSRDSEHRVRLGQQARIFVEKYFSQVRMIDDYNRLYHSVLSDQC